MQRQNLPMRRQQIAKVAIQLASIFTFLGLLVLPKAQEKFNIASYRQLDENRNRAVEPDAGVYSGTILERIYRQGVKFSGEYEKFFNDNYGFRDFLIQFKNQIDFSVFGRLDSVILGSDGFLFSKTTVEEDLLTAERNPASVVQKTQNNILKLREALRQRGVTLVVLLSRDKETIYSDKMRYTTAVRPERTRSEEYVDFFQKHPEIPFIDTKDALLEAKKEYPVFYKTDLHWNSYGAAVVGARLVNLIAELEHSATRWEHPIEIEEKGNFSGTQNLYAATFNPEPETAYEVKTNWNKHGALRLPSPYPFEYLYENPNSASKPLLPTTTIIGNSFSPYYFKTPVPEYFTSLSYVFKGYSRMEALSTLLTPGSKYFILQFSEFDLATYWADDRSWSFLPS